MSADDLNELKAETQRASSLARIALIIAAMAIGLAILGLFMPPS